MNEIISNIQWEVIQNNKNVDEQWHTFTHKVNLFADQLIPRRKVNSNPNSQLKKHWMNTDVLTKAKKKHKLWNMCMLSQKNKTTKNIVLPVTKQNVQESLLRNLKGT